MFSIQIKSLELSFEAFFYVFFFFVVDFCSILWSCAFEAFFWRELRIFSVLLFHFSMCFSVSFQIITQKQSQSHLKTPQRRNHTFNGAWLYPIRIEGVLQKWKWGLEKLFFFCKIFYCEFTQHKENFLNFFLSIKKMKNFLKASFSS